MRSTLSAHLISLRRIEDRESLNISLLHQLLEICAHDASLDALSKGKRRATSPSSQPAKRQKTSETQHQQLLTHYPSVNILCTASPTADDIPAFTHSFNMNMSSVVPRDYDPEEWANEDSHPSWIMEELNLIETLKSLPREKSLDLGALSFAIYRGQVVVVPELVFQRGDAAQCLLALPPIQDELELESFGVSKSDVDDVVAASLKLGACARASIIGRLALVLDQADGHLFTLRVGITTSFTPSIFEQLPLKKTRQSQVIDDSQRRVLQYSFPDPRLNLSSDVASDIPFFYSALGPAPISPSCSDLRPKDLQTTLLPFQQRTVAWLLEREGVGEQRHDFSFWEEVQGSHIFYVNRLTGNFSVNRPELKKPAGAILAEEPGLGKTVEIIALLLLNPAPLAMEPNNTYWDAKNSLEVAMVKGSLIVTPASLSAQWISELQLHAPTLEVLLYEGWNKLKMTRKAETTKVKASTNENNQNQAEDWVQYCHHYDVVRNGRLNAASRLLSLNKVIVTYTTLRSELNVAHAPPKRPRREDVVYSNLERERSPLIRVEWQRVVMDEVQMVGGGNIEDMVAMIPRRSSFAVSGTPVRAQLTDLSHVLQFLRVDSTLTSPRFWARLLLPTYSHYFSSFFSSLAIRTTKASIKDELRIPPQTRFVVPITMGVVERTVYDADFDRVLLQLGLDHRGVDLDGNRREPDIGQLRAMVRRLRAICTHPQVGQLGNSLFKNGGSLKTMDQVLELMRWDTWGAVIDDCKSKIQSLIRTAQLQQQGVGDNCYQVSLETLILAENESTQLLQEIDSSIAVHEAILLDSDYSNKGKGKARESSVSATRSTDTKEDEIGLQTNFQDHRSRKTALKNRRREAQLIMHRVKFLQGDVYHMLGEGHGVSENAAYEAAESLRQVLLSAVEQDANQAMKALGHLNIDELLIRNPFLDPDLQDEAVHEANAIINDVINQQSTLLWQWRTRLTELLLRKLSHGEEEADGQEYQRTLDDQGEAEHVIWFIMSTILTTSRSYLVNYTALVADRREALLKERTLLATHDATDKVKIRRTKAAQKAAMALDDSILLKSDIELQPEHEVLFKQLSLQRQGLLSTLDGRALKSVIVDLAQRIHKLDKEKIETKEALEDLRRLISQQAPILEKLEADLATCRKVFNARISYFRQLQDISDAVADVTFETTLQAALEECAIEQRHLSANISAHRARRRYLDHLVKQNTNGRDDEENACILCRSTFMRGFMTECAHVFCEDCLKLWIKDKARNTCPVCRIPIKSDKLERFIVAEDELQTAPISKEEKMEAPRSRRQISYNEIDQATLQEIQGSTPAFGDYGAKIATLVQHLLYLRNIDPGTKSIVFSAWADSLYIAERALKANGISFIRIDQNRKGQAAITTFATSSDIEVLLLHGERENAGLNVTCASRVFLLEPVVHHGFEVQAIARIDRISQSRPTEVYCYYAQDTIEKNILDLAARRGLSLYTTDNSVDVSSLTEDNGKESATVNKVQKGGDLIFKVEDMMAILFPHLFEDFEYMVPAEAMEEMHLNAVAGPSRTVQ
ncbi:SNF2 family helicase [Mycena indigotica]|uniref:SNF2 family helicase n=1 Tax=Mycena indigotica TaxID=2126181 RepID=A0A8H6T465_9AGAR|nr:SNF2 family helicase [Mycena indigotica]KAF7309597.1 SNF2 family helicase [Mycena indigotica]